MFKRKNRKKIFLAINLSFAGKKLKLMNIFRFCVDLYSKDLKMKMF